jgi:hypothetical protein
MFRHTSQAPVRALRFFPVTMVAEEVSTVVGVECGQEEYAGDP